MRRMLVSRDGSRRLILKNGERKAIQTDRTVLVPGSKGEVDCVRTIFELAAERKTPREITKELNVRHMRGSEGRLWDHAAVYRILRNEKYAGVQYIRENDTRALFTEPSGRTPSARSRSWRWCNIAGECCSRTSGLWKHHRIPADSGRGFETCSHKSGNRGQSGSCICDGGRYGTSRVFGTRLRGTLSSGHPDAVASAIRSPY
jgi:Recombinase